MPDTRNVTLRLGLGEGLASVAGVILLALFVSCTCDVMLRAAWHDGEAEVGRVPRTTGDETP